MGVDYRPVLQNLQGLINANALEFLKTEEDWKHYQLAKTLAHRKNLDPCTIFLGGAQISGSGPNGTTPLLAPAYPAWVLFMEDARQAMSQVEECFGPLFIEEVEDDPRPLAEVIQFPPNLETEDD